jgi:predicted metal-dependent peptidase
MASEMLDKAVTKLLLRSPFFGSLLLKLPIREVDTIPTAAISRAELIVNPVWFAELPASQQVHLLAHEVGHEVLQHLTRSQKYIDNNTSPDGEPLNRDLWNQAIDYIVNQMLVDERVGDPIPGGCYWPGGLDLDKHSPESIYVELKQKAKDGSCGGGNKGKPLDEHDFSAPPEPSPDNPDPCPINPTAIAAAAGAARVMGKHVPDVVTRLLGELARPKYNPWRMLRSAINSARGNPSGQSWRWLNRRMIVRGIGMPSTTRQGPDTVGVIIDVSGSIGDDILKLFFSHLAAILDAVRPRLVIVYWVDSDVRRVDKVRHVGELKLLRKKGAPGGGGTDMTQGVMAAAKDRCDSIVCLTDGYTPFGTATLVGSHQQMVWAITSDIHAPWGTTVQLRS